MTLQNSILTDMHDISLGPETISALKVVVGELQRQPKKELADNEVIKIIKGLLNHAKELNSIKHSSLVDNYIKVLTKYIPEEVSDREVLDWIKSNVDFSKLKNKNQAIGMVTKFFGARIDGNRAKGIVGKL